MVATYLKRLPPVQAPCVNCLARFVKLPCSTRSEIFMKWAAFLLQDSDSSLARNSKLFRPVCTSLIQQRWRQTWCSEDKMCFCLAPEHYLFLLLRPQHLAWWHPRVIPKWYSPEPRAAGWRRPAWHCAGCGWYSLMGPCQTFLQVFTYSRTCPWGFGILFYF